MKANSIGWIVILYCVAVALTLSALAHASGPTLTDRLVAVQPMFQSAKDEPVDARELAEAIAEVAKGNRQWAALVLTMAVHETQLADRARRGEFKDYEADSYKEKDGTIKHHAWGTYQLWRNLTNDADWGSTDIKIQTRAASRMLKGAYYRCAKSGVPFPLNTIRAVAGRGCAQPIKGEQQRLATYERLLRRL